MEADRRFHQVRSIDNNWTPPPLDKTHPVVLRLTKTDEPVHLIGPIRTDAASDSMGHYSFWEATEAVLCVPIRSEGKLLAFVTLSRELSGQRYGTEDCDLLRAISHQVGVLLSHARLAEERRGAVELEALHRLSAFCLHDLKNLTARLSLAVQNAELHGDDPAFSKSAMRIVAGTVQKMMALMTKLSGKAAHRVRTEAVDVCEVITETVGSINWGLRVPVVTTGEVMAPVRVVREQLQQVLLNVILNARQASGEGGEIRVSAEQVNESVVITVADTGPGIPPAELRMLFQPFRTTKQEGLGIGLYECKQIVEAYRGAIRVESEMGRGTRVRIELPIDLESCLVTAQT